MVFIIFIILHFEPNKRSQGPKNKSGGFRDIKDQRSSIIPLVYLLLFPDTRN